MPIEKQNKLVDLSVSFAVEILNLVKYLKEQRETIISNQIGRAGTSIGAKKNEAVRLRFIHRRCAS
jgi:four helix bundle protein